MTGRAVHESLVDGERKQRQRQIRVSTSISSAVQRIHVEPVGLAEPVEGGAGRSPARWDRMSVLRGSSSPSIERVSLDGRGSGGCGPPRRAPHPAAAMSVERRVAVLERELARGAPWCPREMVMARPRTESVGKGAASEDRCRRSVDSRRVWSLPP